MQLRIFFLGIHIIDLFTNLNLSRWDEATILAHLSFSYHISEVNKLGSLTQQRTALEKPPYIIIAGSRASFPWATLILLILRAVHHVVIIVQSPGRTTGILEYSSSEFSLLTRTRTFIFGWPNRDDTLAYHPRPFCYIPLRGGPSPRPFSTPSDTRHDPKFKFNLTHSRSARQS